MSVLRHIPNTISILRILLVIPIIYLIWVESYTDAFILMIIAGVSDAFDGFLARAFHWQSQLGAILDPIADKLLLVSIFAVCGLKGFLPWWLIGLIFLRDLIIVAGVLTYRHITHDEQIKPLLISKMNTALQILLAVVTLYQVATAPLPYHILEWLIGIVAVTTFISGIAYIRLGTRYTLSYRKNEGNHHK